MTSELALVHLQKQTFATTVVMVQTHTGLHFKSGIFT